MNNMEVKIKKLYKDSKIPAKAHDTDAGFDLYAHSKYYDENGNLVYGTGVAIAIPKDHVGLIFTRSSISKKNIYLTNAVAVIDNGFTGEITMKFKVTFSHVRIKKWYKSILSLFKSVNPNDSTEITSIVGKSYVIGDRIGQLIIMPYPSVEFKEVDELPDSERGTGGYGSTGN